MTPRRTFRAVRSSGRFHAKIIDDFFIWMRAIHFWLLPTRSAQCRLAITSELVYYDRNMCLKLLGFSAAVLRYQYCTSTNNRPCAPCAPPSDVHTSAVTLPVRHRDTIALVAGVATHASPPRSSGRFYAIPIGFFDQWRAQIFSLLAR